MFCYGSPHEYFALLTKDASGAWRTLLDGEGVPVVAHTKSGGWPDIEVGGPGSGPFPLYRWNGKVYGLVKR